MNRTEEQIADELRRGHPETERFALPEFSAVLDRPAEPARMDRRRRFEPLALATVAAVLIVVLGAILIVGRFGQGSVGSSPVVPTASPLGASSTASEELIYQMQPAPGFTLEADAYQRTADVLERRLTYSHLAGVVLWNQGVDEVVLSFPVGELASVRRIAGSTGLVEIIPLPAATYGTVTTSAAGPIGIAPGQPLPDDPSLVPLVGGTAISSATPGTGQGGGPTVEVILSGDATQAFATYTANHVGDYLAIVLDGIVVSTPSVSSAITGGQVVIEPGVSAGSQAEEVSNLLVFLNSGPLPFPLREVAGPSANPSSDGSTAP